MNAKRATPDNDWRQWLASNEHDGMRHADRISGVIKALAAAKAEGEPIGKSVAYAISGIENDVSWSAVAASCRNHADATEKAQIKALAATRAETLKLRKGQGWTVSELADAVADQIKAGKTKQVAVMEVSQETKYSPSWVNACYGEGKPAAATLTVIPGGR